MLNVVCDHKAREQMFYTALNAAHPCFTLWNKIPQGNKDHIPLPEIFIDEMHILPCYFQWVRNLSLIFLNQRSGCKFCQLDTTSAHAPIDTKGTYQKGRTFHPHESKIKILPLLPQPLPLPQAEESLFSSDSLNEEINLGDFDDYSMASIWSGDALPLFNLWTFYSSGLQALPDFASTWRDRGYRLPPYFAQISNKKKPTDFISQLLPTMDNATQEDPKCVTTSPSSRKDQDVPSSSSSPEPTLLGVKGMLDEVGRFP
jgi:hypothetical protein